MRRQKLQQILEKNKELLGKLIPKIENPAPGETPKTTKTEKPVYTNKFKELLQDEYQLDDYI